VSGGTWIAVDGGQSTTRARASWTTEDAAVAGFIQTTDGFAAVAANVSAALAAVPDAPGTIDRLVVGHTGLPIDHASRDRLARMLLADHPVREVVLAPDEVTAHAGALGGPGVVSAVGTGCVTLAVDAEGRGHRIDGWGFLFGDAGSAFAIGRAALEAALRSDDGRNPPSSLVAAVHEVFGGSPRDATWALYQMTDRIDRVARFAPRVIEEAEHDAAAAAIVRHAAEELAHACATAAEALPGIDRVAVTGRLIAPGSRLEREFIDALAARAAHLLTVPSAGSPLDGAARIAADGPSIYRPLVEILTRPESSAA